MATHTQPISTTVGACGSCKSDSQVSPYTATHKTVKVQGYINQAPSKKIYSNTQSQCELAVSQCVTQKRKKKKELT